MANTYDLYLHSLAWQLLGTGDADAAARLLDTHGQLRAAGKILRGRGRTREAARLFARGRAWAEAESCYLACGERLAAARCAMSGGNYLGAAPTLEDLGEFLLAARCYARACAWRHAAPLFARSGNGADALSAYGEWLRDDPKAAETRLGAREAEAIVDLLAVAPLVPGLLRLLDRNGRTGQLLAALVRASRLALAAEIYASRAETLRDDALALARQNSVWAAATFEVMQRARDTLGCRRLQELAATTQTNARSAAARAADDATPCGDKRSDGSHAAGAAARHDDKRPHGSRIADAAPRGGSLPDDSRVADAAIRHDLKLPGGSRVADAAIRHDLKLPDDSRVADAATRHDLKLPDGSRVADAAPRGDGLRAASADNERAAPLTPPPSPPFASSRFFRHFGERDRRTLWALGRQRTFAPAATIVDFGEVAAGTYTLLEGEAAIYRRLGSGREILVDTLAAGQTFGESWLLVHRCSDVRVVAAERCVVHVVARTELGELIATESHGATLLLGELTRVVVSHLTNRG